jgi:hypothetical protein
MSFKWTGDLPKNILKVDPYVRKRVFAAAKVMEPRSEAHLKSSAPWTDRTGAARAGLTARAEDRGSEMVVVLSHGVDYGIWLEIAHSGAYAVIVPSLPVLGQQYFKLAARLVFVDSSIGSV